MGGKWRRRNHQNGDSGQQMLSPHRNENHSGQPKDNENPTAASLRLGSHTVTRAGANYVNRIANRPFQRNNIHQNRPCNIPHPSNNYTHDHSGRFGQPIDNKRFKQYLLHSISETKRQIELWCPDKSDEEMDWQPEPEFLIPQPGGPMMYFHSQPRTAVSDQKLSSFPKRIIEPWDQGGFLGRDQLLNVPRELTFQEADASFSKSCRPSLYWREPGQDTMNRERRRAASEGDNGYRMVEDQALIPLASHPLALTVRAETPGRSSSELDLA